MPIAGIPERLRIDLDLDAAMVDDISQRLTALRRRWCRRRRELSAFDFKSILSRRGALRECHDAVRFLGILGRAAADVREDGQAQNAGHSTMAHHKGGSVVAYDSSKRRRFVLRISQHEAQAFGWVIYREVDSVEVARSTCLFGNRIDAILDSARAAAMMDIEPSIDDEDAAPRI